MRLAQTKAGERRSQTASLPDSCQIQEMAGPAVRKPWSAGPPDPAPGVWRTGCSVSPNVSAASAPGTTG